MTLYEHLLERGLEPTKYHVIIDEEEYIATFLLYDITGKIVGYQRYNPRSTDKKTNDPKLGRYYTYTPRGVDAILGWETDTGTGPLFFVEGVFKQAAVLGAGFNCVSPLGNDPKRLRPLFRILRQKRPLFAIGDGDLGGSNLPKRVGAGCQSLIDLDEMPVEHVRELCTRLIRSSEGSGCLHPNHIEGDRIPLRYGSAATVHCVDCDFWAQERDLGHKWEKWHAPGTFAGALIEDDER